ncbi:hypothetical protein BDF19DRAFT_452583 [Syncephalis fuscata]|nr:hypothetical protein BDF19DRAFT_452583 [Syncephalis fuscata]
MNTTRIRFLLYKSFMHSRQQAIALYRAALRTCDTFPIPSLRSKLKYNVRDLFDLYRHETEPKRIATLIENGQADLRVLTDFNRIDKPTLECLFKKREVALQTSK